MNAGRARRAVPANIAEKSNASTGIGLLKFTAFLTVFLFGCSAATAGQSAASSPQDQYSFNIDSRAALIWYPLEKPLNRGLVVSIVINGKPVKAAIDTGNTVDSAISLSSDSAAKLGIVRINDKKEAMTYLGPEYSGSGIADSIAFGGLSMSKVRVSIDQHLGFDPDVGAVIGARLLQNFTLVVDPDNRRARFLFPGELSSLRDGINVIPLKDGPRFPASLAAVKFCDGNAEFTIDTGSNGDVSVKKLVLQRARCEPLVESDVRASTSAGPLISRRIGIAEADMSGISLGPVLAEEIPDDRAQALAIDGTIGLGVLSRFSFALDISSRRLLILGYSRTNTDIARPTIGLQFKQIPGALEIVHVEANSPASGSSLKVGDKICFVGDKSVSELGDRFDTNPAPGRELGLKTCDGRAVTITASDFLFPASLPRSIRTNLAITGVGDFTTAVVDCLYGDDKGKNASCTKVIEAPAETRSMADFRTVAFLFRAKGKSALGDAKGAQEDYRHVLELDPNNTNAAAALKGSGL
jgi:hypothetical protein